MAAPIRRFSAVIVVSVLATLTACTGGGGSPAASTAPAATGAGSSNGSATAAAKPSGALSAETGGVTGGETITITGSGLAQADGVRFGTEQGAAFQSVDDATIRVQVPASVDYQPAAVPVTVVDGDTTVTTAGEYSYELRSGVDKQMQYLFAHWDDYNTKDWGDMNPVGGDCANFTSQGLIARGWEQRDDWFSRDQSATRSESWGYTPSMDAWFEQNAKELGAKRLGMDQLDQLKVGDVGMFDWEPNDSPNHVMTVSKVEQRDGKTKVFFVSHNEDGDYRDLDTVLGSQHPDGTAWFWSLDD